MDASFSIEQANVSDIETIIKLLTELWPKWELDRSIVKSIIKNDISTGSRVYLLGKSDDNTVGLGILALIDDLHYGKIAVLDELIVLEAYRGRKIGTNLLNAIVEIAKNKGCSKIQLKSNIHRLKAHEFYKRNGFENTSLSFRKNLL